MQNGAKPIRIQPILLPAEQRMPQVLMGLYVGIAAHHFPQHNHLRHKLLVVQKPNDIYI